MSRGKRKRISGPKPQFRDWNLFFDKIDGEENRQKIIKEFTKFWLDSTRKSLIIPGNCSLGGPLFGVNGHYNGEDAFVGSVSHIERLNRGRPVRNKFPNDLLCATTKTGEKYYLFADTFDLYMLLLMGDIKNDNLNLSDNYYLHPRFRGREYL